MEKPKILLVDDEPAIHKTFKKALKKEGYELLLAENGLEAVKILKRSIPDLIFLDLRMPVMDGLEFLAKIDIKPEDPYLVVVITAHGDEQDVRKSYDLGVNFFLRKPLSMIEICCLARRCIGLKAVEREIRKHRDDLEALVEERTVTINEQLRFQQHLIDSIPTPVFFKDIKLKYLGCNTAFEDAAGLAKEEIVGKTVHDIIHEKETAELHHKKEKEVLKKKGMATFESPIVFGDGNQHDMMVCIATFTNMENAVGGVIGTMFDITRRRQAEYALTLRSQELEEANSALRVVLDQIGNAKLEVERRVFRNIKELVLPDLDKLRSKMVNSRDATTIDIIKSNLAKLTTSPTQRLSSIYMTLSPREIQIADFVRMGKSNKSIALMLNISRSAVEFHRNNLREKLGLKNKKLNLRSYLMNLE